MGHAELDLIRTERNLSYMEHNQLSSVALGSVIKQILKEESLSQNQLAISSGIPRNTLNRKINGGIFDFNELTRISQVVKKKLSTIIALAEEQES
jgi:predicted transcriptional regulator